METFHVVLPAMSLSLQGIILMHKKRTANSHVLEIKSMKRKWKHCQVII